MRRHLSHGCGLFLASSLTDVKCGHGGLVSHISSPTSSFYATWTSLPTYHGPACVTAASSPPTHSPHPLTPPLIPLLPSGRAIAFKLPSNPRGVGDGPGARWRIALHYRSDQRLRKHRIRRIPHLSERKLRREVAERRVSVDSTCHILLGRSRRAGGGIYYCKRAV
jgi:hypothetical protein